MSYIFDCEYPDTNSVWMLNVQIRIWIIYLVSVALRLDGQSENIHTIYTRTPRARARHGQGAGGHRIGLVFILARQPNHILLWLLQTAILRNLPLPPPPQRHECKSAAAT
jgi:hypothetical protein